MFTFSDKNAHTCTELELAQEEMYYLYASTVIRVESGTHKIYPSASGGKNLIVGTNTVIGKDGFVVVDDEGTPKMMPSLGEIHIGENVVIGANCSICRGVNTPTRIFSDVKIADNVVINSGAQIGIKCIIHSGCIIGAGAIIGNKVVLPPGTIVKENEQIEVDKDAAT